MDMKFKKGDKVRCIPFTGHKGLGWKECLEFTIDYCKPADQFTGPVYFPNEGHGVYEEALELVDEQTKTGTMTKTVKKSDLKKIYDVACSTWQGKIEKLATRNPFGDDVELTQSEVDEMFKASDSSQTRVLEEVFGKQQQVLDFRSDDINLYVDGLPVFSGKHVPSWGSFIGLPLEESYKNCFYLNQNYKWTLKGNKLTVTRK